MYQINGIKYSLPDFLPVGKILRGRRNTHLIKAKDLADAVGISPSYLSSIERGRYFPDIGLLIKICDFLDVPLKTVFAEALEIGENWEDLPDGSLKRKQIIDTQ